jgi:hypothetical protein
MGELAFEETKCDATQVHTWLLNLDASVPGSEMVLAHSVRPCEWRIELTPNRTMGRKGKRVNEFLCDDISLKNQEWNTI